MQNYPPQRGNKIEPSQFFSVKRKLDARQIRVTEDAVLLDHETIKLGLFFLDPQGILWSPHSRAKPLRHGSLPGSVSEG